MASKPFGETRAGGPVPADNTDPVHRAVSVLDTAERVARKIQGEAREEAQRLIAEAREESERIRDEARGDAPELQRATEQLRVEQQRILHDVEALRDQLDSVLDARRGGTQRPDGQSGRVTTADESGQANS
jgi:cell division septum initiation protein DivIVA